MKKTFRKDLLTLGHWLAKYQKLLVGIFTAVMLPAVYWLVYMTGGIAYVYSHTMYIPILLAGVILGVRFGALTGIIAGVLLGPLMPIDTTTGEPQLFFNWLYRLIIFTTMGALTGYIASRLRYDTNMIEQMSLINQETQMPNTNILSKLEPEYDEKAFTLCSVLINNYQNIIDVLGTDVYNQMLHTIYQDLKKNLPKKSIIMQAGSSKLWIIKPFKAIGEDVEMIFDIINQARTIEEIPLYIDYAVGASVKPENSGKFNLSAFTQSDTYARFAQKSNLPYVIHDERAFRKQEDYLLLTHFSRALKNGEVFLAFQPKYDIETLKPYSLEALSRWHHKDFGLLEPDRFIPLIEETNLIHVLTDWVFEAAVSKLAEFKKQGLDLAVSLNISAKNLYDPTFFDRVMEIAKQYDFDKQKLTIEITETSLMKNPEDAKRILDKFVNKNIKISIDDFGSGYSSLAYLSSFPIDTIKIDRFFMRDIEDNTSVHRIVKATIALAHDLGYHVVAEGIEDKQVLNILKELKCDRGQGFYLAKPMDPGQLDTWLKELDT